MDKAEFNAEMSRIIDSSLSGADEYARAGRYYDWSNGYGHDHLSLEDTLERVKLALASDDPVERVLAMQLLDVAHRWVSLPEGAWVVFATYKDGWGGPKNTAVWSAHATEEEAKRWSEAWDAHWKANKRSDYLIHYSTVGDYMKEYDRDGVPPHYLRRPDAEAKV